MGEQALSVEGLSFSFGGRRVVDDVSFAVDRGEIVGLVGPERSGKSTLLHLALGLLRPEEGRVELFGEGVVSAAPEPLRRVGTSLGCPSFYEEWTGRRNLRYAADLRGARDEQRVNWTISHLGLGVHADKRVRTYPPSFRQRLALARSLVGGPSLLVLDEPTRGLDPEFARTFRKLLRRLARDADLGVLLATGSLVEAADCADRLIVIDNGRVIHEGPSVQVRAAGTEVVLTLDHAERAAEDLVRVRGISSELASSEAIRLGANVDATDVVSWLIGRGHKLEGLARRGMTLEELLVRLARGPLPPPPAEAPPRPENVKDVLELLDDSDTDLSAFLERSD